MIHLGDITKISGRDIDPVDCITFGSPCQDLSQAGKRAGLDGERSGLFIHAVRIIKEMRENTNGRYPTFAIWENVPGAFNSNRGEDFRTVLEQLARIKEADAPIPRPEKNKWAKSGIICGDGYSIAWRTFDAQYWGVPQRRRRIAVVVDFAGHRAGEILFESKGVPGHTEPCIQTWKETAGNFGNGIAEHDCEAVTYAGVGITSKQNASNPKVGDPCHTLSIDSRNLLCKKTCFGITSVNSNSMKSDNPNSGFYEAETSRTLDANGGNPTCNQGGIAVCFETYSIQGSMIGRDVKNGPQGDGISKNVSFTLNTVDRHAVVYESHSQDARYTQQGNTSPSCTAQWGTGGNNMPIVVNTIDCRNAKINKNISGTLQAKSNGGYSYNCINPVALFVPEIARTLLGKANCSFREDAETFIAEKMFRWIVRRLTPTECERLQGFPDGWTDIGEWTDSKGKRRRPADSPRYKALGNSIALPQWWWITCKMATYLPKSATLGSLFDGIGGFPLVWETRHGKGTAIWASEIEEFPIAVTKKWFA